MDFPAAVILPFKALRTNTGTANSAKPEIKEKGFLSEKEGKYRPTSYL